MVKQDLFLPSTNLVKLRLTLKGQAYRFDGVAKLTLWLQSETDPALVYVFDSDSPKVRFFADGAIHLDLGREDITPGSYLGYFKAYGSEDTEGQQLAHPALRKASLLLTVHQSIPA